MALHRNPLRLGYAANFMYCATLCRGDLIAFCDQDDIWMLDKIEVMERSIANTGALLAFHNSVVVGTDLTPISLYWNDKKQAETLAIIKTTPWANCPGFSQLFHRSLLQFSDLRVQQDGRTGAGLMPHDNWLFFVASALGAATYVDLPLVQYRQHAANTAGYPKQRNILEQLYSKLLAPQQWDSDASKAALLRAKALEQISEQSTTTPAQRCIIADCVNLYKDHAYRLERRVQLYAAKSPIQKLVLFSRNAWSGDYGLDTKWRFSPLGACRDLLFNTLLVLKFKRS